MQKQVLEHNTRGIGAPASRSLNVSDDLGCFSRPPIVHFQVAVWAVPVAWIATLVGASDVEEGRAYGYKSPVMGGRPMGADGKVL